MIFKLSATCIVIDPSRICHRPFGHPKAELACKAFCSKQNPELNKKSLKALQWNAVLSEEFAVEYVIFNTGGCCISQRFDCCQWNDKAKRCEALDELIHGGPGGPGGQITDVPGNKCRWCPVRPNLGRDWKLPRNSEDFHRCSDMFRWH